MFAGCWRKTRSASYGSMNKAETGGYDPIREVTDPPSVYKTDAPTKTRAGLHGHRHRNSDLVPHNSFHYSTLRLPIDMGKKFEQLHLFEHVVRECSKQQKSSKGQPVSISASVISDPESQKVSFNEEGQFSDVKSRDIAPRTLTKTISAFANTDGGDLYIGVDEVGPTKIRQWRGFDDQESANGHLQCFEDVLPLAQGIQYEFLRCESHPGLVLHLQVNKTRGVVEASNSMPYVRRGAQNLPVDTPAKLRQLEFNKGIASYESEPVSVPKEFVTESVPITEFMRDVVPQQQADVWLKKQVLLVSDKPTVAGLLLFADEPQAALPKRCGIKLYRYKTTDAEGFREALAFDPITVEGWLYSQIATAVSKTTDEVEKIPRMGTGALESVRYPPEALHEVITNAVLHRDYSLADDVHIRIFDNRIEVENPGRLPAHITVENILSERFARNGSIVRILNKFPNPPNKDVGEGLNTAFSAMHKLGLKEPVIEERDNSVLVTLKHEKLASPEEAIMDYLEAHEWIDNKTARQITHIPEDHKIRSKFRQMEKQKLIERNEGATSATKWRKKERS